MGNQIFECTPEIYNCHHMDFFQMLFRARVSDLKTQSVQLLVKTGWIILAFFILKFVCFVWFKAKFLVAFFGQVVSIEVKNVRF